MAVAAIDITIIFITIEIDVVILFRSQPNMYHTHCVCSAIANIYAMDCLESATHKCTIESSRLVVCPTYMYIFSRHTTVIWSREGLYPSEEAGEKQNIEMTSYDFLNGLMKHSKYPCR